EASQTDSAAVLVLGPYLALDRAQALVAAAMRRFIPVVGALAGEPPREELASLAISEGQLAQWTDLLLLGRDAEAQRLRPYAKAVRVLPRDGAELNTTIAAWLPEYRRRILPKLSIVTILYRKAVELPAV